MSHATILRRLTNTVAAVALLTTVTFSAECVAQPVPEPRTKPNIIVILADDLGYADTSADPGGRFPTPNIDRIAQEGVRFADGYATAPVCAPSRAGLLTGRYQERFGFEYNDGGAARALREGLGLPLSQITIAQILRADGYHTGLIGKWHEGELPKFYPMNRGFDAFIGFLPGESSYIDPKLPGVHLAFRGFSDEILHELVGGKTPKIDAKSLQAMLGTKNVINFNNNVRIERIGRRLAATFERHKLNEVVEGAGHYIVHNEHEYLTDYFADQATQFIARSAESGKPYFLYLAFNAPHAPLMVTDKYYRRFPQIKNHQLRVYAAMISALDDGIGRVLDAVRRSGIQDNTIIFFASDNGCAEYNPGLCSNTPLRGGKLSFYEGGIRVPFLMAWPGHIKAGMVYREPVSLMDVLPTSVAAAGGTLPTDRVYDGVDLIPYLTGEKGGAPHSFLAWQAEPLVAIRSGDWKLWETEGPDTGVYGHYKLLFNLRNDLNESTSLESKEPYELETLEDMIHRWEAPMIAPLWQTKGPVTIEIDGRTFRLPV